MKKKMKWMEFLFYTTISMVNPSISGLFVPCMSMRTDREEEIALKFQLKPILNISCTICCAHTLKSVD